MPRGVKLSRELEEKGHSKSPQWKPINVPENIYASEKDLVPSSKENRLYINLEIGPIKVKGLLDTGASRSYVSEKFSKILETLGNQSVAVEEHLVRVANGDKVPITKVLNLWCGMQGIRRKLKLYIMPGLASELIIGIETMKEWKLVIDIAQNKVSSSNIENTAEYSPKHNPEVSDIKPVNPGEMSKIQLFLNQELPKFENVE